MGSQRLRVSTGNHHPALIESG